MKILISLLCLAFSSLLHAEEITFAGSSTVMPIMEDMVPVFEKNGFKVNVQGGGSSAGLKSVKMGMAQVGMVSRALTPAESQQFKNVTLAKDWIVMIANKSLGLSDISSKQVVELYTNPNNKQYHLIAKEDGRATKKIFDQYFGLKGKLRKDLIVIGANGQAIATVEKDPSAIAYVSYGAALEAKKQGSEIAILSLDGIEGSAQNVASGQYKLARDLNLVYLEKNAALIEKVKWVLSTEETKQIFAQNNVISSLGNNVTAR